MVEKCNSKPKGIVNILLICIYINLVPIIISSQMIPNLRSGSTYKIMVGGIFIIQNLLIWYHVSKCSSKMNSKMIMSTCLFSIMSTITPLIQLFSGQGFLDKYDFINIIIRLIAFLTFTTVLSNVHISKQSLNKFFNGIVKIGIIASVYNLFINGSQLISILSIKDAYAFHFQSFYLNRNSFAQLLYFSLMANTAIYMEEKTKYRFFLFLLLGINLIATFSRGALLAVSVFMIVLFSIVYKNKILKKVRLLLTSVILFLLLIINSKIRTFIIKILIRSEMGTTTRSSIWNVGLQLLNETNWFFGIGEFSAVNYLNMNGYNNSQFHSFYIETLVAGGIMLLIFFLGIFWFMGRNIKVIKDNDTNIGNIYTAAFISLAIYGFFESVSFFTIGYVGSIFSIFFISLPMIYSNNYRKGVNEKIKL